MTRRVTIQTPLGDLLQLRRLTGREAISELFALDVELLSPSKSIDPHALLGKNATVAIETAGGGVRHLDGIVTRFGMAGQDHKLYAWRMRLSPWLWLASRRSDFRIFQFKTVPQILAEVLGRYGYPMEQRLTRSYRAWDYCVQYGESDFQFAARLMEHEGIYWHHEHSAGQHVLVLADDVLAAHRPLPGAPVIAYQPPDKLAGSDEECIYAWRQASEILPGRHATDDYDFQKPRADLAAVRQDPPGHAHDAYERYEWPGGYTEYGDGEAYTRVRLESQLSAHSRMQGTANHRSLACGHVFTLKNYPREDQNQAYLLAALEYHFEENAQVSSAVAPTIGNAQAAAAAALGALGALGDGRTESGSVQRIELFAHPTRTAYRPQVLTPKPRTQGPQTAVVVGPAGEEIWTDQCGRVKVQFHWDRIGAMDEHSSCWVRVSSSWAGPGFGAVFTPRIGMEVIVDFLSGDPDYPILMGCVYNADNMPPWGLPGNQTQSGIKTKSSKGGAFGAGMKDGAGDANAIRFEDKAGAEQLWFHAQKDQLTEVENDEKKWVGNDREKLIDRDETTQVKRDRTETVDRNEKITVHGWRSEEVDGDETIEIHSNRVETVDLDERVTVHKNQTFNVDINRTKNIGKSESDTIGKNWSIQVGKMKTESVGIGSMQNVGVFKMVNVGMAYSLNVGMVMNTVVGMVQNAQIGMTQSTTVGQNYSLSVGAGGGGGGAGGGGDPMVMNIQAPSGGGAGAGGGAGGGGSSITMDAETIRLNVGKSTIVLKADGSISITGQDMLAKAEGNIVLKATQIDQN